MKRVLSNSLQLSLILSNLNTLEYQLTFLPYRSLPSRVNYKMLSSIGPSRVPCRTPLLIFNIYS